ncbi:MAG: NAD-glutamate dehydrogenase [Verrucomicrobiales bacterium]|nr:NAD-glutamate dehydrogenase [Verrucomicrobiales bacterium]
MSYLSSKDAFVRELVELSAKQETGIDQKIVEHFASGFFRFVPYSNMVARHHDSLLASAMRMLEHIIHYPVQNGGRSPKISVLDSRVNESRLSVIAILQQDSPFLVDSVRMELTRLGLPIRSVFSLILYATRDDDGKLLEVNPKSGNGGKAESIMCLLTDPLDGKSEREEIRKSLLDVLEDVHLAVDDFEQMRSKALAEAERLRGEVAKHPDADTFESAKFLEWIAGDRFIFLGFDEHRITVGADNSRILEPVEDAALGIMTRHPKLKPWVLDELPREARDFVEAGTILTFVNSTHRSRVHRPVYPDYIAVRRFDEQGNLKSACRFLGLFASNVYHELPAEIPIIRRKVQKIFENSDLIPGSHYAKSLSGVLNSYPRDELFQATEEGLFETAMAIVQAQEIPQVRLFLRQSPYGRFHYAQVLIPRELFHTSLRRKIHDILEKKLGADDIEISASMGESELVRMRFIIRVPKAVDLSEDDIAELERQIVEVSRSWDEDFVETISTERGDREGSVIGRQYRGAFPASYRDHYTAETALLDIDTIAELKGKTDIALRLTGGKKNERLNLRLFHREKPLPLSDVIPILENMGLRINSEHPYRIESVDGVIWISQFVMIPKFAINVNRKKIVDLFREAFIHIWHGHAENDGFNALIPGAGISWRDASMFRAYSRYNHQVKFGMGNVFTAETLERYLHIVSRLNDYFHARFDPETKDREKTTKEIEGDILEALNDVPSLNEDRVLRRYLELMKATLRTSYFQKDRPCLSFKFNPAEITNLPLPRPAYEIFVYSPRVEGIHLRGGRIARGGLRWSDRPEDFRTEVLGLVKAQQVKNAVIVPVGAKGGFVAHQLPLGDRAAMIEEGKECYRIFLRGMLDLTDNLKEGRVVPPPSLVRHDSDDPYLVVAADKGTATFSDTGNAISEEYDFWLGDAFASGGSEGYDHKKMGITARGAWVSVVRHFCELGINAEQDPITVVGIGDMSGDVFGNGVLCSEHLQLVAAFNHLHIFIDPNPDPAASYKERQRLFDEVKGWGSYDTSLLSPGGAIFSRQQKTIELNRHIRERFQIEETSLTPNALINELLRAPVDLLWNGGIGTFVKASSENHADVGDKTNDALRVNAPELQCRVIGEGGNLGLTQLARVEYCLNGGYCNTDFIDNSGGVDCSDHEVNLKIPLNKIMEKGGITREKRNELLVGMTDSISELVLQNNYRQTRAISLAQEQSLKRTVEYTRLLEHWERNGQINRTIEALPDNESLSERTARQMKGLTRPELSVLIAYSKSLLKETLINSDIIEDIMMAKFIEQAFPDDFIEGFRNELYTHQLRREIVATQWANDLVNHMGASYIYRIEEGTGATPSRIVRAYAAAREIFSMPELWKEIEALDFQIAPQIQHRMMYELSRLVRRGSRWLVRNCRDDLTDVSAVVSRFQPGVETIRSSLRDLLHEAVREYWETNYSEFTAAGVPEKLAASIAGSSGMFSSLNVIYCAEQTGASIEDAAQVYFYANELLDLHWLSYRIRDLGVEDHWQARARESFRDELHIQQRILAINILSESNDGTPLERINNWIRPRKPATERWKIVLEEFRAAGRWDYAMYPVAMRELGVLVGS